MTKKSDGMPAWMTAQALVIKAKNVLTEAAIDALYKEIEAKRMSISGTFMPIELEKSGEMEQGLYLIRRLMEERENLEESFGKFIEMAEKDQREFDATAMRRVEEAKKFLLAVATIDTLTRYGMVFDGWFGDASSLVNEGDPAEILAKTAGDMKSHRAEALDYLVASKLFKEEGIFTVEERGILSKTKEIIEKQNRK